ncbi:hypothetical protein [Kitasatospora sp. McL0602]
MLPAVGAEVLQKDLVVEQAKTVASRQWSFQGPPWRCWTWLPSPARQRGQ